MQESTAKINVFQLDYPDPDVIRVGDTYYMVSTTMHFMPGCEILRSFNLVDWEHAAFVYETLDGTKAQRLEGNENIYGKGMWAASIRRHKGMFYICFAANDTHKTYLYVSSDIEGPWEKRQIAGFYHDPTLFFDEDDRVYLISGNREITLVELKPDVSGPLEGGRNRVLVSDTDNFILGYEGSHFYKISGRYYLFVIHSLPDRWRRVEACFCADSLDGVFAGGDVFDEDFGYCGQGIAQGGIVDTPDGKWYAMLFQDHGASGRMPVLIPVSFCDRMPVFDHRRYALKGLAAENARTDYEYRPLVESDDFCGAQLKSVWQFNHEPDLSLVRWGAKCGGFCVRTAKLCVNFTQTKNMLTQRMCYPECSGEVTVDGRGLNDGDYAGICALQGCYGMAAVTKRAGQYYIVMCRRKAMEPDPAAEEEMACIMAAGGIVRLRVKADFTDGLDEARFFFLDRGAWRQIGPVQKLYFKMDHFTGCRFGLFVCATKTAGGEGKFMDFVYRGCQADV